MCNRPNPHRTPRRRKPDVLVTDHGTVWTFRALTRRAKDWVETNVDLPDWAGSPERFAADWRPAEALAQGLEDAGFVVARG